MDLKEYISGLNDELLDELYNELIFIEPSLNINLEFRDTISDNNVEGYMNENRIIILNNLDKEYNKIILSHELLHKYFLLKSYPNHFYLEKSINNPAYVFGEYLYNCIIHKLIIEEQIKRGFCIKDYQIDLAKKLLINVVNDESKKFAYAINILNCELICGEYKYIYKNRIEEKFSSSFKIAKQLYNCALKVNYTTIKETREALVRIYKKFDELLKKNGYEPLNLSKKVIITYLPDNNEWNKKVTDIFYLYDKCKKNNDNNIDEWILISKKDNQASFILISQNKTYKQIKEYLNNITIKKLYRKYNYKAIVEV